MTLEDRLHGAGTTVPVDGVFERVQRLRAARRKQRMVRKAVAGVAAVAAVGGTVFVIAQRKDDGHRIVTDEGTTTTSTADRISDASKFESISDADREAVTKVAETFFSSTTTAAERETLLEHGSELRATLAASVGSPPGLPTGASGKPTVTVLGRVGNTAFADLKFASADSSGGSSSSASAEFNFDTSGRGQQFWTQEIIGLQFVRTNDRWQVAATSWCSVNAHNSTFDSGLQCPTRYSTLVRVVEGEARFETLDQTNGQVLQPDVYLERETAWNSENFREVAIPGGVVAYQSATDGDMANPEFPRSELIRYSDDGTETGRLRLDGMISALTIDESVEPRVLWAHTQSGLQDQPKDELVRVPTDLSAVTARVPLDGATGLRDSSLSSRVAFVPTGDSVAYVDLGFIDDTTQPAPVDLVTIDLSGNETARIRLVDQATSSSGEAAGGAGGADGVVAWGFETRLLFADLSGAMGVAVGNNSQAWIVNLETGSVVSSALLTGQISDMVYSTQLYLAMARAPMESMRLQIVTMDAKSGRLGTIHDSGQYGCVRDTLSPSPGRFLVACDGPDPAARSAQSDSTWKVEPSKFLYEFDGATGKVTRTLIVTGHDLPVHYFQPDPNALLFDDESRLMRVELPAER